VAEHGSLHVRVLTPEGLAFEGSAAIVFAPSAAGEVGILPRHEPMVCALKYGQTRVRVSDDLEHGFVTTDGFVTIDADGVLVLVGEALPVGDIDPVHAKAELQAAEEALTLVSSEEHVAYARAQTAVRRAQNIVKAAESHK